MAVPDAAETTGRAPVLIAAWPGMGNVGAGAVEYLRRALHGRPCARLDVAGCWSPDALEVQQGIGRIRPPEPEALFLVNEPPLLLFEGSAQPDGEAGLRLAGELLDFAVARGVETVYTGAAFATAMSCRDEVGVYGVATDDRLRDRFGLLGVEPLAEGRVSGLNGLLLGLAAGRGLSGACFLATMPQYAVQTPNPKASRALIRVFERILNTTIDLSAIDRDVERLDRLLGEFERRVSTALRDIRLQVADAGARDEDAAPGDPDSPDPEPGDVMERIERLFEETERDHDRAPLLKQELDRWGLFALYEDRFLDLFAPHHRRTD